MARVTYILWITLLTPSGAIAESAWNETISAECQKNRQKWGGPTNAGANERVVRVRTRPEPGRPGTTASGFLYQSNRQVVTNLHAIRWPENIYVSCNGDDNEAEVALVYEEGDLVLLNVLPNENILTGATDENVFPNCSYFVAEDFQKNNPCEHEMLYTQGWYGDAIVNIPKTMTMNLRDSLGDVIGESRAEYRELEAYGVPKLSHEIYSVSGGSLPGYSGSFVVNNDKQLVAIIDGGLDDGQTGYNWVIPVEFIDKLMASNVKKVPPRVLQTPDYLWSSSEEGLGADTILRYKERDEWRETIVYDYEWFKIKTRTLEQMERTSSDPASITHLRDTFPSPCRGCVDQDPSDDYGDLLFDIYEDIDQRIVIATPADQGLNYEQVSGYPGFYWLESRDQMNDGHTQYKQTRWPVSWSEDPSVQIHPADEGFFNEQIAELLADCNKPRESSCWLDPDTLRIVTFDNGNKILKAGFGIQSYGEGALPAYDYYNFAVRPSGDDCYGEEACESVVEGRGVAFRTYLRFHGMGEVGPKLCGSGEDARICANPTRSQLAQMIAVSLTTYANMGLSTGGRVERDWMYDASGDDPTTIRAGYFEGDALRFYNSRGKIWLHYPADDPGKSEEFREIGREGDTVTLRYGEDTALVPVLGGSYSVTRGGMTHSGILHREG